MELPDESVSYQYQHLLFAPGEDWTALSEMRARHCLHSSRLKDLQPRLMQAKSQTATDREVRAPSTEGGPVEAGFIDLPQATLDNYRRKGDQSDLGRVILHAAHLREQADRIVLLGVGGAHLGARVLFSALKSNYHNELPTETRLGVPRLYFEGDGFDNDALQELLDLIQVSCVDYEQREERWAVVVLGKSGSPVETSAALRVLSRDAVEYYGHRSEWLKHMFLAVTGTSGPVRERFRNEGHPEEDILTIPDNVNNRFAVFSAAGLLPAAIMGLDVRALLQGAATMTKRFLEEPFERNPVLQLAAVNYLTAEELGKPLRVLSLWSKKLEPLGAWYDQLVSESLAKLGRGPTTLTLVQTRDMHTRGQNQQEGPRDRVVTNVVVKNPRTVPIELQMTDRNEDGLNPYARKSLPQLMAAAHQATARLHADTARPTADLIVPTLSEHTLGQLLQLLMLATVVEARLMGINPYSTPTAELYRRHLFDALKG